MAKSRSGKQSPAMYPGGKGSGKKYNRQIPNPRHTGGDQPWKVGGDNYHRSKVRDLRKLAGMIRMLDDVDPEEDPYQVFQILANRNQDYLSGLMQMARGGSRKRISTVVPSIGSSQSKGRLPPTRVVSWKVISVTYCVPVRTVSQLSRMIGTAV